MGEEGEVREEGSVGVGGRDCAGVVIMISRIHLIIMLMIIMVIILMVMYQSERSPGCVQVVWRHHV